MTAADHKASVTNWLTTYDPRSVLTGHFMASPLGPQMAEALEGEGEAIQYLANLPPAARAGEMKKLEGYVHAQQMMRQNGHQQPQVRKVTAAPPPIRSPRGGASPPTDIYGLAARGESADDYVKARLAMEKKR
jgi:hypothetical protein